MTQEILNRQAPHTALAPVPSCAICGAASGKLHRARENMFGLGDEFAYMECRVCGCLQLSNPPLDMKRFYPPYYFSYEPPARPDSRGFAGLRRWLAAHRNEAQLFDAQTFWGLIARLRPRADVERLKSFLEPTGKRRPDMRILDVGSGAGKLLSQLAAAGCRSLLGVDPYLRRDLDLGPFARVLATQLGHVVGEFDVVMFNHSLEHMQDPTGAMRTAAALLHPDGVCIIAVPVASSDPWLTYGTDWVELDAPRHYFLHTRESLARIAHAAGLEIYREQCDSNEFAYWGSELYRRGLSLYDFQRQSIRKPADFFSPDQLREFTRRAAEANASGRGGRATFYLRKCREQCGDAS